MDASFRKALAYLGKHKKAIHNAFKFPYSNGKIEGKNNLIKAIQRVAFGFHKFINMRKRILIQQEVLCIQ